MTTKIVLVEDEQWYAEQQMRILQQAGYQVFWAQDSERAMQLIDEHQPEGVILDVLLTYNTALALLHELRSYDDLREVKIVIYSTRADIFTPEICTSYGIDAVLDKATMNPGDTVKALRRVGVLV